MIYSNFMEKHKINALISQRAYDNIEKSDLTITEAINEALTYYFHDKGKFDLIIEEYNKKITSLQSLVSANLEIKAKCVELESHIDTLKKELENYNKREENYMLQIAAKDGQLEKQAVHIQSLIQENSKLNVKLLPDPNKKPWYKFW